MTGKREHSRDGAASGLGARSGAGELREDDDRQAFGGEGQFTGRPVPPQATPAPAAAPATEGTPAQMQPIDPAIQVDWVPRAELDEATRSLQRVAADFDNFRKRAQREKEQVAAAADAKLLGELLDVLDDLERALGHAEEDGAGGGPLGDGIRMVHGRLNGVLNQHGLSEVPTVGQFDPHLHEAIMMQPAEGTAEGTILNVVQKGYQLGDRVLRHAKVVVAG